MTKRSSQNPLTPHWHEAPTNKALLPCLDADYRTCNPHAGGLGSGLMCIGDVARTARKAAEQAYVFAQYDLEDAA
jgi:hypothetical protein